VKNQREFFDNVSKSLGIDAPDGLLTVGTTRLVQLGGSFIRDRYNGSLLQGLFYLDAYI
jgi:hypothetical protein